MFDTMLIAHHGVPHWQVAKHCHLPDSGDEPVVWVEPQGNVAVWHPALPSKVIVAVASSLTPEQFAAVVAKVRGPLNAIIRRAIEDLGVPPGYYASYPDVARRIRAKDNSWVAVADERTDAEFA